MAILSQLLLVAVYTTLITTAGVAVVMAASSIFRARVMDILDDLCDRSRTRYEILCYHVESKLEAFSDYLDETYEAFSDRVDEYVEPRLEAFSDYLDDKVEALGDYLNRKFDAMLTVLENVARFVASLFRGRRSV